MSLCQFGLRLDELYLQGSDMEADDDDFQDIDNAIAPHLDDEFMFHMEDIFPTGKLVVDLTCSR